jgi:hypothetical protein
MHRLRKKYKKDLCNMLHKPFKYVNWEVPGSYTFRVEDKAKFLTPQHPYYLP